MLSFITPTAMQHRHTFGAGDHTTNIRSGENTKDIYLGDNATLSPVFRDPRGLMVIVGGNGHGDLN